MKTGLTGVTIPALLGLALAWLVFTAPVSADEKVFRDKMRVFAKQVREFLDTRDEKDFRLGHVFALDNTNSAPGIRLIMKQELETEGVVISRTARFGFHGKVELLNDEKQTLKIEIVGKDNKKIHELEYDFVHADLPGPPPPPFEPEFMLKGDAVYNKTGEYGIEIVVEGKIKSADDKKVKGMVFVDLKENDVYQIRLFNYSKYEAAVWLQIDGLNIFAFNEDPEPNGKIRGDFRVIVAPGKSTTIQGWYRKNGISDSFKVTEYANAAAAQSLKSLSDIGVITATFRAAGNKKEDLPQGDRGGPLGTGFGPPVNDTKFVRVERVTGIDRATLVIRYDLPDGK